MFFEKDSLKIIIDEIRNLLTSYLVERSRTDHRRHPRDRSQNAMSRLSRAAENSNAPFPHTTHHSSVILSSRGRLHH